LYRSDHVILLKNGCIDQAGPPLEVIQQFRYEVFECKPQVDKILIKEQADTKQKGTIAPTAPRKGNGKALITKTLVNGCKLGKEVFLEQQEPIEAEIEAVFSEPSKDYSFGLIIVTSKGADIFTISSRLTEITHPPITPGKPITCRLEIEHNLQPGEYYLQVGLGNVQSKEVAELLDAIDTHTKLTVLGTSQNFGIVDFPYSISFPVKLSV
jgi:hypothetical protein